MLKGSPKPCLVASYKFGYAVFLFLFSLKYFLILIWFIWPIDHFEVYYFNSNIYYFLLLISNSFFVIIYFVSLEYFEIYQDLFQ